MNNYTCLSFCLCRSSSGVKRTLLNTYSSTHSLQESQITGVEVSITRTVPSEMYTTNTHTHTHMHTRINAHTHACTHTHTISCIPFSSHHYTLAVSLLFYSCPHGHSHSLPCLAVFQVTRGSIIIRVSLSDKDDRSGANVTLLTIEMHQDVCDTHTSLSFTLVLLY